MHAACTEAEGAAGGRLAAATTPAVRTRHMTQPALVAAVGAVHVTVAVEMKRVTHVAGIAPEVAVLVRARLHRSVCKQHIRVLFIL